MQGWGDVPRSLIPADQLRQILPEPSEPGLRYLQSRNRRTGAVDIGTRGWLHGRGFFRQIPLISSHYVNILHVFAAKHDTGNEGQRNFDLQMDGAVAAETHHFAAVGGRDPHTPFDVDRQSVGHTVG